MEPSEKAEPRKRQVQGWRQLARRTADANRRMRKGVGLPARAVSKGK